MDPKELKECGPGEMDFVKETSPDDHLMVVHRSQSVHFSNTDVSGPPDDIVTIPQSCPKTGGRFGDKFTALKIFEEIFLPH
jgi:hypothetical protein